MSLNVTNFTQTLTQMAFKIFYSWQSTTRGKYNRYFIKKCLTEAIDRLTAHYNNSVEFYLDHDTKEVPGYPNIVQAIQQKVILESDVYIADFSVVDRTTKGKAIINPNVQTELGIAMSSIGNERIVLVMNHAYGDPAKETIMPFDIAQYRYPIGYDYSEANDNDSPEKKNKIKDALVDNLFNALVSIFDSENERLKKEYEPFDTWKTWEASTPQKFAFEENDYILQQLKTISENIAPGNLIRILGLSGIGKTKMLLECFRPGNNIGMTTDVCDRILYANMNECDSNVVIAKIKELFRKKKRKTIVLDNCPLLVFEQIKPLFSIEGCELNLITISPEPNESQQAIDLEGKTLIIKLVAKEFQPVVRTLLQKNFELTADEIELLVDYSNGLSFYADLMATNKETAIQQPGSLTNANLLDRLLGPLYNDENNKTIIKATAIFSRFGFIKDNEPEYKAIALSQALCPLPENDPELRTRKFKEICDEMRERGLLEDVGFSLAFRPTPLALRLAEEWWRTCTTQKFNEILPILKENGLVEKFCQQFRLLQHVAHAKEIVANLCDGVFNSAEVLNTEEGSRIFRSFVDVNPQACAVALTKAFSTLGKQELSEIDEGRRNLVWALEKLCFRADTFQVAIRIMASFAVAENENISNNATQQFLQLFHIFLPGTTVDLETRWDIIIDCINKDRDYFELGIKAAMRALKSDSFHRMGGPSENEQLIDYRPTHSEVISYWEKAIAILENNINDDKLSADIIEVLINSLYGLSAHHAGAIILPVIKRLLEAKIVGWLEVRSRVRQVLRSNRVFDKEVISGLENLLSEITPDDFVSQIMMYVVKPTSEDYFSDSDDDSSNFLQKKVSELAEQFLLKPEEWTSVLSILFSGHIAEGINWGKSLGNIVSNPEDAHRILAVFFEAITHLTAENRNVGVLMGFLRTVKYKEVVEETFEKLISNIELQSLVFSMASNVDLSLQQISQIIHLVEKGAFPVSALNCFLYGWGLKHLEQQNVLEILSRISQISNEGKALAFGIAYTWSYNDEEAWVKFRDFLRQLLIQDAEIIMAAFTRSQDFYYWSEAIRKLLRESNDNELADIVIKIIIKKSNSWDDSFASRNDFYNILDVLQQRYFVQLWENLQVVYLNVESYGAAAFHFRDLLGAKHDYYGQTEGIIFKDNPEKFETVFNWAKDNKDQNLYWIAEWLPVFANDKNANSKWHPYALAFLSEFGTQKEVLSGISAKIGSYSWVGSVIGRYETVKEMFVELLNHPLSEVKRWASENLKITESRLDWERNHESEFGI